MRSDRSGPAEPREFGLEPIWTCHAALILTVMTWARRTDRSQLIAPSRSRWENPKPRRKFGLAVGGLIFRAADIQHKLASELFRNFAKFKRRLACGRRLSNRHGFAEESGPLPERVSTLFKHLVAPIHP